MIKSTEAEKRDNTISVEDGFEVKEDPTTIAGPMNLLLTRMDQPKMEKPEATMVTKDGHILSFPIHGAFLRIGETLMRSLDDVPSDQEIPNSPLKMAPLKSPGWDGSGNSIWPLTDTWIPTVRPLCEYLKLEALLFPIGNFSDLLDGNGNWDRDKLCAIFQPDVAWIINNLCSRLLHSEGGIPRSSLFLSTLWQLWKSRNDLVFNSVMHPSDTKSCYHMGSLLFRNLPFFLVRVIITLRQKGWVIDIIWAAWDGNQAADTFVKTADSSALDVIHFLSLSEYL
ncbi:hypothetical protein V6N11_047085 [Hibiscus sabdariffa]|uniref:Aminotransferase-like plant mobile domain-containing protein n=2 Tax=Hibiscus sabdariffa TaxID=183260 RepID=A0ABR2ADK1_9ROSI